MATRLTECAIELRYDRREDGRFHIHSPDLPGLHLIGPSPDALMGDLEPVLRDMLRTLTSQAVDTMLTIPTYQALGGYGPAEGRREIRRITFKAPG